MGESLIASISKKLDETTTKKGIVNLTSNLSAATLGAISFGLLRAAETDGLSLLAYPASAAVGAITNYGIKDGLENLVLKPKDVDVSNKDLVIGAISGFSGSIASLADETFARTYTLNIGKQALGELANSDEVEFASRQILNNSIGQSIKLSGLRGIVGGSAGSFTYSVPSEFINNWQNLKKSPLDTLSHIGLNVAENTALGGLTGGVLGLAANGLAQSPKILKSAIETINPAKSSLNVDFIHINDFHSSLEQLPGIKTVADSIRANNQAQGLATKFVVAGDVESGNLNFTFTQGGKIENEAFAKIGVDTIIPGNHPYDIPGGGYNVDRYPQVMKPILDNHPNLDFLAANLDLSHYPDYQSLVRPYSITEIPTKDGVQKLAQIALITPEGAVNNIGYLDAVTQAQKYITELNQKGINKIVLITHLGLDEDKALASELLAKNLKVAAIIGGHSHDITPYPIWVSNDESAIPIVHAGSKGRWLGQLHLAIGQDGSAIKSQTFEKLHIIDSQTPQNQPIKDFVAQSIESANLLKAENYGTTLDSQISLSGIRTHETQLGNLSADSLFDYVKHNADPSIQIGFVNSGGIREGLPSNQELDRFELSKVFINSGIKSDELGEMLSLDLKGSQIKKILEYGVRDMPHPNKVSFGQTLANMFKDNPELQKFDASGNFIHPSGLKYTVDLNETPLSKESMIGNRIGSILVKNADNSYSKLQPDASYRVLTRFHPVDKWLNYGIFGDTNIDKLSLESNLKPIKLSQVDALAQAIRDKGNISPSDLVEIDGRIKYINLNSANPDKLIHIGSGVLGSSLVNTIDSDNSK